MSSPIFYSISYNFLVKNYVKKNSNTYILHIQSSKYSKSLINELWAKNGKKQCFRNLSKTEGLLCTSEHVFPKKSNFNFISAHCAQCWKKTLNSVLSLNTCKWTVNLSKSGERTRGWWCFFDEKKFHFPLLWLSNF